MLIQVLVLYLTSCAASTLLRFVQGLLAFQWMDPALWLTSLWYQNHIPPLSNSDHNGISLNLKCRSTRLNAPTTRRPIWKYKLANFDVANEILSDVNWDRLLDEDIKQPWNNWQGQCLSVMEDCIPNGVLPKRKHPPWITKQMRSAIYKRNQLYRRSRVSNDLHTFSQYKKLSNRVTSMLRKGKKS